MVRIVVVVVFTGGRAGDEAGKRRPTAGHVETCGRLAECVVPNHALERRRQCPGYLLLERRFMRWWSEGNYPELIIREVGPSLR